MAGRQYSLQPATIPAPEVFGFRGIKVDDVQDTAQAGSKIEPHDATDIVTAAHALYDRANYMSLLRPGKLPAVERTTIRHCCGHEVVFEDVEDRCGVAALAHLADVAEDVVLGHLQTLRLSSPAPLALAADMRSPHHRAAHIEQRELYGLLRVLQISAARGRDGMRIHTCRGHIAVVRTNDQRSAVRTSCAVFGSLGLVNWATLVGLSVILAAFLGSTVLAGYVSYLVVWHAWAPLLLTVLCAAVVWQLRRTLPPRLDALATAVRRDRKAPGDISLRHQPVVYGGLSGGPGRLAVALSWAARGALAAGLFYLALAQTALLWMLLYDASYLLAQQFPLANLVIMFCSYFAPTYLFLTRLVVVFTLQLQIIRTRRWRLIGALALATVAVPVLWTVALHRFGFANADWVLPFLWLEVVGLGLNAALYAVPRRLVNWALAHAFSGFHMVMYSFIIAMCRLNGYLISHWASQRDKRAQGERARATAGACATVVDELISFCLCQFSPERGAAARRYMKRCHPDVLGRRYPAELLAVVGPQLRTGSGCVPSGGLVRHACPTTSQPPQPLSSSATPFASRTPSAQASPLTTPSTSPPPSPSAPPLASLSGPPSSAAPTSLTASGLLPAAPTADGPVHWSLLLSFVILGLVAYGLLWVEDPAPSSDLLDDFDALVLAVPFPDPPRHVGTPYRIVRVHRVWRPRGPRAPPKLLEYPVSVVPVPAYWANRHGLSPTYYPGARLDPTGNWGEVFPNPTSHPLLGDVRPDLRVRNPTVPGDPLLSTQWTLHMASAIRAFGLPYRRTPRQRQTLNRLVPSVSRIGANEMYTVLYHLLDVTPMAPLHDPEFEGEFVRDVVRAGYSRHELTRFGADDGRLYQITYLDPPVCKPLDVIVMGAAASGKTTTYMRLIARFRSVLIVCISNELAEDLRGRVAQTGHGDCTVTTPHRPLLDGHLPHGVDLVILDEVFAFPRPLAFRLAALGRQCIGVGDPTQITDLGLQGSPMVVHTGCAVTALVADFSFTMPHDIASFLITCGRLPRDFVTLSPVARSVHIVPASETPPNLEFRALARQCGPTIHTFQGQRVHTLHVHVCEIDLPLWSFSGTGGHGTTAITRHTDQLYLSLTPRLVDRLRDMMEAYREGF